MSGSVTALRREADQTVLDERLVHIERMLEALLEQHRDRSKLADLEPWVSRQELARFLGCSASWLDPLLRRMRLGRDDGHRFLAGKFVYKLSAVESYLQAIGEME